jgi:hypothetical protein
MTAPRPRPRRSVKSMLADIAATISTYELELAEEESREQIIVAKIEALRALRDGVLPDITRRPSSHAT